MNDNFNAYNNLTAQLAETVGIDFESAQKVVSWLITEGVLDAPVVNEEFGEQLGKVA